MPAGIPPFFLGRDRDALGVNDLLRVATFLILVSFLFQAVCEGVKEVPSFLMMFPCL